MPLEEGVEPANPALEVGRMLDEGAIPDADAAIGDGAMPEEDLKLKLADGLVRKPVDAAVPMG